jgi:ribonuclease HII
VAAELVDPSRLTVAELRELLAGLAMPVLHRAQAEDIELLQTWGRRLAADPRGGVRQLAQRLLDAAAALRTERRRVAAMLEVEVTLCPAEALLVAGVDEAGRGPLAGPVVAAAVVLRPGAVVPGLDDSKRIAEDVREEVYSEVLKASLHVGVGIAGTALVERLNIVGATRLAMRRAVGALERRPDYVLVDGFRVPDLELPQRGVIGGDATCASIAAASVVAKVTRDRIMRKVARRYPGYGFERNKGYATREHWAALRRLGPCPAHRLSFLRKGGESLETTEPEDGRSPG